MAEPRARSVVAIIDYPSSREPDLGPGFIHPEATQVVT